MTHALPSPDVRFERYHVAFDGKHYIAEYFSGQAREVQVEVGGSHRRGYHKPRTIWYGLSNGAPVPAKGRAAEVLACINNPDYAAANHAEVEDHTTRCARIEAESAERRARWEVMAAANERAAKIAEAAPALLAALKAYVHADLEAAGLRPIAGGYLSPALAAIAEAEGNA